MRRLIPRSLRTDARRRRLYGLEWERGDAMRLVYLTCLTLILIGGTPLWAQNVVPPPGFVPGQDDGTPPSPPADSLAYPRSRTSSGSGDYPNPFGNPGPNSDPEFDPVVPGGTQRPQTFRAPSIPTTLFVEDGPPMPRVWFKAEALFWWSKNSPLPVPIVTQGYPADTIPGALGQPGTSVILGNQNIGLPMQPGGRYTFGFTFDAEQTWGTELTYFSLATASVSQGVFADGSPGSALLAFPFYDPNLHRESSSPIALPGYFAGSAVIILQSSLRGTELNLLRNILNSNGIRLDLLGGFRYVNFQEGLNFNTDSPNVYPNPPAFFHTFDQFNTTNNFYGGQFGVRASYDSSIFFMNATTKLALGDTFENVSVNGGTFTNFNGGFSSANGGYLTQPTNIGSQTRSQFGVIPEFDLNLGVRLRPWASIIVGYSFLYLSSVARPGNQIDRVVNPTQSSAISNNFPANLSGNASPFLSVHNTDFWAQGLNLALELRF